MYIKQNAISTDIESTENDTKIINLSDLNMSLL